MIADDIYEHIYWGPEPFCSFLSACPQLRDRAPVAAMCAEFKARHEFALDGINGLTGFRCRPCDGAFYAFPEINAALESLGLRNDTDFCERLLEQRGVALVPGSAFGSPGHVRLSFATGMESLRAALDRLHLFVN